MRSNLDNLPRSFLLWHNFKVLIFSFFQVFACIGAIQAIFGLMSPIYQYIYKATYDFYLGFVYVVAMGILSLMLAQTIYVFFFLKKYDRQMKMAELSTQDQDTSENNKDNIDGPNSS